MGLGVEDKTTGNFSTAVLLSLADGVLIFLSRALVARIFISELISLR